MMTYVCSVCGFEHSQDGELADDWACPVCGAGKSLFESKGGESEEAVAETPTDEPNVQDPSNYLKEWARPSDDTEEWMKDIHEMAETGHSLYEPMRTTMPVVSWDDILIRGAQLNPMPLAHDADVSTKTIIGRNAVKPMELDTPVMVSHMSYGALSKEAKTALAKGSALAGGGMCSGEGGILKESREAAHKYIFEYVPNEYSVTEENLKNADAIEIKIGQSAKPGMGGHLPGDKVTEEIAEVRGRDVGQDIISPSSFSDIRTADDLKAKVDWLRETSGGRPIGIKIAAGNIEDDLMFALTAKPDFITIDGRAGATGSAPKYIKAATSVPTIYALYRARQYLDAVNSDVSLIITGGFRVSSDMAKALAMGADAVAIASAAMMAIGCQQYRMCNSGKCPIGIATQDPELRKRFNIDHSAKRLANYLTVCTEELKVFARITGCDDVQELNTKSLFTTNSEISEHTDIQHA